MRDGLSVLEMSASEIYFFVESFFVESTIVLLLSFVVESIVVFGESTIGFGAGVGANKVQDTTVKVIAITHAMALILFFILFVLNVINLLLIRSLQ